MCIYKETSAQSAMHTVTSKGHAVKSASLRRVLLPTLTVLMLCTCVYISEQTLGGGPKESKTTEQTISAAHTHITLPKCDWCCAEGAVIGV